MQLKPSRLRFTMSMRFSSSRFFGHALNIRLSLQNAHFVSGLRLISVRVSCLAVQEGSIFCLVPIRKEAVR